MLMWELTAQVLYRILIPINFNPSGTYRIMRNALTRLKTEDMIYIVLQTQNL